jgi:hypothetical protein
MLRKKHWSRHTIATNAFSVSEELSKTENRTLSLTESQLAPTWERRASTWLLSQNQADIGFVQFFPRKLQSSDCSTCKSRADSVSFLRDQFVENSPTQKFLSCLQPDFPVWITLELIHSSFHQMSKSLYCEPFFVSQIQLPFCETTERRACLLYNI